MNAFLTIGLLLIANVFMFFAWYGHLKLQQMKIIGPDTPLLWIVLISWGIALVEYFFQVPANRIGYDGNGGVFTLLQLKVIQEVLTLLVFVVLTVLFFKNESFHWNHFASFACLVLAVYFAFMK